jgi:hypothetical protein
MIVCDMFSPTGSSGSLSSHMAVWASSVLEFDSYEAIQYSVASKCFVPVLRLQLRKCNVHKSLRVEASG